MCVRVAAPPHIVTPYHKGREEEEEEEEEGDKEGRTKEQVKRR